MPSSEQAPQQERRTDEDSEEAGRLLESYAEAMEKGRLDDADETLAAFLESLSEWVETQPEHEETWVDRGDAAFEAGDFDQAEQCYLEAVADTEGEFLLDPPRSHLITLYGLLGRSAEAVEIARAQVRARQNDIDVIVAGTLETLGGCLREVGDLPAAEAAFIEALDRYALKATSYTLRARVLVALAGVRYKLGNTSGADADLQEAWDLVTPLAGRTFSGADPVLASWWGVTARRRESIGDIHGAVEAWREAVECRRRFGTGPLDPGAIGRANRMLAFADTLRQYAEALRRTGDVRGASDALFESQQVRASVGLPPDEE